MSVIEYRVQADVCFAKVFVRFAYSRPAGFELASRSMHRRIEPSALFVSTVRRTRNAGRSHLFLGHPLSDLCDKTTVEAGNTFSPGIWTYGVAIWIELEGAFITPDLLPAEKIKWQFCSEAMPLLESIYEAGTALEVTHRLGHQGGEGAEGIDYNHIRVAAKEPAKATLWVVIRDEGPAGAKIDQLSWEPATQTLKAPGNSSLTFERPEASAAIMDADAGHDSPLALIGYSLDLPDGGTWELAFRAEHGFAERQFGKIVSFPSRDVPSVDAALTALAKGWRREVPARVFAPDPRIAAAWEASSYHLMAAMECGFPRIGVVTYPVFWIRDCVMVLRALDMIGRHDLARRGQDYLAPLYFGGGFGAESDAPGQGIWSLVQHAGMAPDREWLASIFPHLQVRIGWLEKMLNAKEPLRWLTENRTPHAQFSPGVNIVCLAAKNGLIHGRMDWHSPDFYINAWAVTGFRQAAWAARELGQNLLAIAWLERADEIERAMATHLLPHFGNPRDSIVTPHPAELFADHRETSKTAFSNWYQKNRLTPEGKRNREPRWSYFEIGQIHNAMRLGLKDWAWINLDGILDEGSVFTFCEGSPKGAGSSPYGNTSNARGWLQASASVGGNMPHLWSGSELLLLLRTLFVREENGVLQLGEGIPDAWLTPGARFGVENLPTSLGPVSYTVAITAEREAALHYRGPAPYHLAFGAGMNILSDQ